MSVQCWLKCWSEIGCQHWSDVKSANWPWVGPILAADIGPTLVQYWTYVGFGSICWIRHRSFTGPMLAVLDLTLALYRLYAGYESTCLVQECSFINLTILDVLQFRLLASLMCNACMHFRGNAQYITCVPIVNTCTFMIHWRKN